MKDNVKIGKSLLSHAEAKPLPTVTQTTALLPYMVVAARKMSARDICRFFSQHHGVEISHSTIARALKNKKEHYRKIAEFLEQSLDRIPAYFEVRPARLISFEREWRPIYEEHSPLKHLQRAIAVRIMESSSDGYDESYLVEVEGVVSKMIELWDEVPEEAKREIFPLIDKSSWGEGYEYEFD